MHQSKACHDAMCQTDRPQVSPSTPDTVESIATSKAAPRDIPSASSTGAGLGEDNSLYASWNYGGI